MSGGRVAQRSGGRAVEGGLSSVLGLPSFAAGTGIQTERPLLQGPRTPLRLRRLQVGRATSRGLIALFAPASARISRSSAGTRAGTG